MKKFKWLIAVATMVLIVFGVMIFSACEEEPEQPQQPEQPTSYTVTYYDGDTVLDTETVESGKKATDWTPTKSGYVFVDWFATPNFSHVFDFNQTITQNTSVFAQWQTETQTVDTRTYYIVGSGTSPVLSRSDWGENIGEDFRMTKDEDSNVYTFTLDLYVGDLFQFAINSDWHNQRGVGYLTETELEDGTLVFSGASTIGDNSSYRLNIECELAGNYTFTLTTHPDDDQYETNNASYTEENKEAFNINPLDTITWVRNGDVDAGEVEVVTDFYIKGAGITNWLDMYNASTEMTNNDGVYTLSVYLKEGEEFMFTSRNTIGSNVTTGTEYLRASNLDEESKEYVGGTVSNMTALASGTYTFTYTSSTKVLSVDFDAENVPQEADYYIDGTFDSTVGEWNGYCFNENFKLTDENNDGVFEIKNVALTANSQLIIQAFKAGSTERGEYGTPGYNGLGSYNYTYLSAGGDSFSAVGGGNNNILVLVAGNYNITFDSYSKIITITAFTESADIYDLYVKGAAVNGWSHDFAEEYRFALNADETAYELEIDFTAGDSFGFDLFAKGVTEGYGTFIDSSYLGTNGDGNANFVPESGTNFVAAEAGKYKVVYDLATEKIDFYAING